MEGLEKAYDKNGHVYWHCICPCCGKREAVLFGQDCSRACRFCEARWNETISTVRFVDLKTCHAMKDSSILGVLHLPWIFPKVRYVGPVFGEQISGDDLGIFIKDGKPIVGSRTVAAIFEKRHDNVMRDIKSLDCSVGFHALNFEEMIEKIDVGKGAQRESPVYSMTRDGFIFLCMGYSGKKAALFKEAYINKFNEMETEIRKRKAFILETGGRC